MVFFLEDVMTCTKRLLEWIAGWLPRHFIGAILVSLPALSVYSHVTSEFETNIHVSRVAVILCPGSSGLTDHFFFFFLISLLAWDKNLNTEAHTLSVL